MHSIADNLVLAYPDKIAEGMVPFIVRGTFECTVLAFTPEHAKILARNDMENWGQSADSFEYLTAEKVNMEGGNA